MKLDIQLPVHPMPDNATRAVIEIALSMAQYNGHTMDAFGYAEAGPASPNAHIPAWMSVCSTEGCYAVICAYGGQEPSFEGTACSDPCPLTLEEAHARLVPIRQPRKMRRRR